MVERLMVIFKVQEAGNTMHMASDALLSPNGPLPEGHMTGRL